MKTLIVIPGDVPSKKNSKQIVYVRGRPLIISSKRFKEWHNTANKFVKASYSDLDTKKAVSLVSMVIYPSTRRKSDLSNKFESVADLLVDTGILEDDNWFVIPKVVMMFGGVDKSNPRVEVEIED